jgi:hypothetical protein
MSNAETLKRKRLGRTGEIKPLSNIPTNVGFRLHADKCMRRTSTPMGCKADTGFIISEIFVYLKT